MKIKILKQTVCNGEVVKVGDVVEANDRDARFLINIGKAEESEGKKSKGKKSGSDENPAKSSGLTTRNTGALKA